jgi:RNA polymerase sigma factor (sigma-70 family)
MTDDALLAERFEEHRDHLRAVAYRMLGSPSEADDAVQEAWLRLGRAETSGIGSLGAWLTTVVARVCLGMLRARQTRREELRDDLSPVAERMRSQTVADPEGDALLADSIGLALVVVLDTLSPAERTAFVLHDMFAIPFKEIAVIVDRSPQATRQLASRARRRVHGTSVTPVANLARQRQVIEAFLNASRRGDFEALLLLLDPDIILRADATASPSGIAREVHGAEAVARGALAFPGLAQFVGQSAVVNGSVGIVALRADVLVVLAVTIKGAKITRIEIIADGERVADLDIAVLDD